MRLRASDPLSEVLSIDQAAQQVSRSAATLRDWIRKGWLIPMRMGGRTYVTARSAREAERRASGYGEGAFLAGQESKSARSA